MTLEAFWVGNIFLRVISRHRVQGKGFLTWDGGDADFEHARLSIYIGVVSARSVDMGWFLVQGLILILILVLVLHARTGFINIFSIMQNFFWSLFFCLFWCGLLFDNTAATRIPHDYTHLSTPFVVISIRDGRLLPRRRLFYSSCPARTSILVCCI